MSASPTYKSIARMPGIVATTVQRLSSLNVERVLTQPRSPAVVRATSQPPFTPIGPSGTPPLVGFRQALRADRLVRAQSGRAGDRLSRPLRPRGARRNVVTCARRRRVLARSRQGRLAWRCPRVRCRHDQTASRDGMPRENAPLEACDPRASRGSRVRLSARGTPARCAWSRRGSPP